ncbi:Uncharacterised protein [Serratia entomophila]|nr:Uncharacterised protein [Serratia entomophila]CAI0719084.1 Uncharacterised protein [Serratia entomophila]CAI0841139.1 Uncharacterised protein [Serratia entomophila]CAI1144326.1 Uncharacterised protein [Serratia entomophila]CAI1146981.1 Uncharacterised protein [Serratia entomophila]
MEESGSLLTLTFSLIKHPGMAIEMLITKVNVNIFAL